MVDRRPYDLGRPWISEGMTDGWRVATISAEALHRGLAEGIATAIGRGVPVEFLDGMRAFDQGNPMPTIADGLEARRSQLQDDVDQATLRSRNAAEDALSYSDADLRAQSRERAEHEAQRVRRLQAELEDLAVQTVSPTPPAEFTCDADYVVKALANLARSGTAAEAALDSALQRILADLSVEPDLGGLSAIWSCSVLLPLDGRVAKLGPITGTIPVSGEPMRGDVAAVQSYFALWLARHRAVSADLTRMTPLQRRRVVRHFFDRPEVPVRSRLLLGLACLPEPLQAVGGHLAGVQTELDQSYRDYVCNAYLDGHVHGRGNWPAPSARPQAVLHAVAAHGGDMGFLELQKFLEPIVNSTTVQQIAIGTDTWGPAVERYGTPGSYRIRSRVCPHCQTALDLAIRVPEVTTGLLCRHCLREPTGNSPVFPQSYLTLEAVEAAKWVDICRHQTASAVKT